MRILILLLFLFFAINGFGQKTKKRTVYHTVKTILTDVNNDNQTDTITLSSSLVNTSTCFNRISISLSGFKKQTFKAKDYWTVVDKWFLDSNKNAVNSKLLFFKKTDKHAVILLFGILDGAGYRGEFSIINIENNNSKMVFDHTENGIYDVEDPTKLVDLEHDGRLCFIYKGIGEFDGYDAKSNGDIGSYVPYFVFPVDDSCKLNKPLTKKYNEEHYVYAGLSFNDKIRVLYPRNKKRKPSIYRKKYTIL